MTRRALPVIMLCALAPALSGCGAIDRLVDSSQQPITQVVLEAVPADDGEVTPEAMSEAVDVLVARLDSDDDREVDATIIEGTTIRMAVKGVVAEEDYSLLTQPGELAFRQVLALEGVEATGPSSDVPGVEADVLAEFEDLECGGEGEAGPGAGDPDLPLAACDEAGTSTYLLGSVDVDGAAVVEASASYQPESATWVVNLELDEAGTAAFAEATERLQGEVSPRNQFAITVDGVVLSAPMIPSGVVITSGAAEIAGSFTRESARALAGQLGTGPLPFPFEVRSVSTK